MKIAIWKTGHEIADLVAEAIYDGLHDSTICPMYAAGGTDFTKYDTHIAYGVLRGTGEVFKRSTSIGKPWFNIDKGYWKPGHYEGHYRVSLCGTQQTTFDGLEPDYDRWDALGIPTHANGRDNRGRALICPPTDYTKGFFDLGSWGLDINEQAIWRNKTCKRHLLDDLNSCGKVITFNSAVGWEALRQGIPVVSDPTHSIVGAYQKLVDKPLHLDSNERRKLFAIQASLQLTLSEMRSGLLWTLMDKLLKSSSATTAAKPLLQMSHRIA